MSKQIKKTETDSKERESDGRFALKMATNKSVQRHLRRDAEREARKAELEALYGEDACMYA
jgi:hypothetical protein